MKKLIVAILIWGLIGFSACYFIAESPAGKRAGGFQGVIEEAPYLVPMGIALGPLAWITYVILDKE